MDQPSNQGTPSVTLVTANFYFNDQIRPLQECFESMKVLLEIPCYLVIFSNQALIDKIKEYRQSFGLEQLTRYYPIEISDLDTYQFKDKIIANREKYWPTRDPRAGWQSHIICSAKFKLVERIIKENPFGTRKFGWIDSNLKKDGAKISRDKLDNSKFLQMLEQCQADPDDSFRIQILNVTSRDYLNHLDQYYQRYRWVVCGSLFVCGPQALDILEDLWQVFLDHTEKGYGHAEEMFYLGILDKFYSRICKGYGDYQDICTNFILPRGSHNYVFWMILNNYLQLGYHREALDCINALERSGTLSGEFQVRVLLAASRFGEEWRDKFTDQFVNNQQFREWFFKIQNS